MAASRPDPQRNTAYSSTRAIAMLQNPVASLVMIRAASKRINVQKATATAPADGSAATARNMRPRC